MPWWHSESKVSAFLCSLGSKALPGTPSLAGLRKPPALVVDSTTRRIAGFAVEELQADEIRSFAGSKDRPTWVLVAIEVWSRLWPSTVDGRRSYRNTLALVRDIANRMDLARLPLIVTDGFYFYEKVTRRVFGPACLYGQVLKTPRNDRVVKVEP